MPKIIIVEPHPLLRLGLVQLLADIVPESEVTGADYIDMARSHDGAGIESDLVLLAATDMENVYEHAARAAAAYSPKAILLMSDADDMPEFARGLPPRVKGYISRHAVPQVLLASVRLVLAGGTCYPRFSPPDSFAPSLDGAATPKHNGANGVQHTPGPVVSFQTAAHPGSDVNTALATQHILVQAGGATCSLPSRPQTHPTHQEWEMLGLTPRQYEVLILLARGHSMKMVGRQLNISAATAKAHAEALYQRLDVHNRNAAVYAAVSKGATLGWSGIAAGGKELKAWAET